MKYQAHLSDDNASIDPERFAFHHLYLQSTKRQIGLKLFEDRQAWRGGIRLRTLDCDDHQLYEANAVVHDASVVQSFCDSELTDGGVSDEGAFIAVWGIKFWGELV